MKNGLQNILDEIAGQPQAEFHRIKVITTYCGKIINNIEEMDSDPNIRKVLPSQDEFNEVYRKVRVEAESNLNLYEIYASENGISWSKVESFTQL
jgi:hypothetical protein